jgi:hypothetical protein
MKSSELAHRTEIELLRLHGAVINELKQRGVVRTRNNPVGDYTEWLVSQALGLTMADNSTPGYDATDAQEVRYQSKGRRVTAENPSRQLSAIRNLDANTFDFLAAVIYDENYDIIVAVLVPHDVIHQYARYHKHVNAHILHLRSDILNDDRVKAIDNLMPTA